MCAPVKSFFANRKKSDAGLWSRGRIEGADVDKKQPRSAFFVRLSNAMRPLAGS